MTRRQWARDLIARCPTTPPRYGSPEWLALPDGPEKVAACVIAAEEKAYDDEAWLERLRADAELASHAFKAAEDAAYLERRDAHRAEWSGRSWRQHPANREAA